MFKVLRKLKENIYEDFGTFNTKEEAEIMCKVIKAFLNYDVFISEVDDIIT